MNYRKKIYWILIIAFVSILFSLVIALPENFGLCAIDDDRCIHKYIDLFNSIVQAIVFIGGSIFVLSIILLFTSEQVFKSWARFAKFYLPIAIVFIAVTPVTGGFLSPDKELTTWWLAGIFLISSLGIIIYKSLKKS